MIVGERKRAWNVGRKGHDLYEWHACSGCGRPRWAIILRDAVANRLCRSCGGRALDRRAQCHQAWRGGRRMANGYVLVYLPPTHPMASMCMAKGRYVLEHRLVAAEWLGRPLARWEIVHHKDGSRSNNNIENLEVTSLGMHAKEHGRGYADGYAKGYADGLTRAMEARHAE